MKTESERCPVGSATGNIDTARIYHGNDFFSMVKRCAQSFRIDDNNAMERENLWECKQLLICYRKRKTRKGLVRVQIREIRKGGDAVNDIRQIIYLT